MPKADDAVPAVRQQRPIEPVHVEFSAQDVDAILDAFRALLVRGRISQGEHVLGFEKEFATYVGSRHAVAVSSGSMAIEAATAALLRGRARIPATARRGEVLVPANTNFATWMSVLRGGAVPRLVDIDPQTLSPSLETLQAGRRESTIGIVLVHMGGIISPQIDEMRRWCDAEGLWLVEDCAHAHGSFRDGRHAGRFGQAGAFSFFATKVITSGEGGMVVTDDEGIAEHARLFRNLGKPAAWTNHHVELGTNGRMVEFAAVIGRRQLARLDEFVSARREIAALYSSLLSDWGDLTLVLPDHPASWYKFVVVLPEGVDQGAAAAAMRAKGVEPSGFIYDVPLHRQPALLPYHGQESYPATDRYCARHFCLPIHTAMRREMVNTVVGAFRETLAELR